MDTYDILVIFLSVFLAIFLLLGIVVFTYLIQILKQAKKVANTVESVAENVETFSYRMSRVVTPVAIIKTVTDYFNKHKRKDSDKE